MVEDDPVPVVGGLTTKQLVQAVTPLPEDERQMLVNYIIGSHHEGTEMSVEDFWIYVDAARKLEDKDERSP